MDGPGEVVVTNLSDSQPSPDVVTSLPPAAAEAAPPPTKTRLVSLDAFRGLTILGMLLVNNVALDEATPRQLTHAGWNQGLNFADLVFPWFLFIVGVAIPYSLASAKRHGLPLWKYDLRVLSRTLWLVGLGCFIDSAVNHALYFDLGVLQLIGLAYGVSALLYELPVQRRLLLAGGLLVGYWLLLKFVPIPGVGLVYSEDRNIINHLNQVYLARFHLNGLLSVIPTSALVMIGTAVGDILRRDREQPARRMALLLGLGLALVVIGRVWALDLPFNKPLWTASYVLYAGGLGCLVLGLMYLLMDINGWRAWALPLAIPGMNAIFLYVVPILVKLLILGVWTWKLPDGSHLSLGVALMHFWFDLAGRTLGGWLYTISYILFWWLIAAWLYSRKIFMRV